MRRLRRNARANARLETLINRNEMRQIKCGSFLRELIIINAQEMCFLKVFAAVLPRIPLIWNVTLCRPNSVLDIYIYIYTQKEAIYIYIYIYIYILPPFIIQYVHYKTISTTYVVEPKILHYLVHVLHSNIPKNILQSYVHISAK
jgi:hypothetical protein